MTLSRILKSSAVHRKRPEMRSIRISDIDPPMFALNSLPAFRLDDSLLEQMALLAPPVLSECVDNRFQCIANRRTLALHRMSIFEDTTRRLRCWIISPEVPMGNWESSEEICELLLQSRLSTRKLRQLTKLVKSRNALLRTPAISDLRGC